MSNATSFFYRSAIGEYPTDSNSFATSFMETISDSHHNYAWHNKHTADKIMVTVSCDSRSAAP